MFNVTVKFDKAEDAAYFTHLIERLVFQGGQLSPCETGIFKSTAKNCKGLFCQWPAGQTMTADEMRKIRMGQPLNP